MGGNPLTQLQGRRRLSLGKQVDLKLQVIAPFERLNRYVLPDQDAGGQEDGLQPEDQRVVETCRSMVSD